MESPREVDTLLKSAVGEIQLPRHDLQRKDVREVERRRSADVHTATFQNLNQRQITLQNRMVVFRNNSANKK